MTDYNWQENPLSLQEELLFEENNEREQQRINKV